VTLPTYEAPRHGLRPAPTLDLVADGSGRDRETRRELAKLTANYVNALGASIAAIGGLAPLVALISQTLVAPAVWIVTLSLSAFAVSLVAHLGARYVLRREFRR
jgi:hypothetical protein